MEEDFASIIDSVPPPGVPDKQQVRSIRYLFGKGMLIGALIATSIGGIFQYFLGEFEENELLRLFVRRFWYSVNLWAWILCLCFLTVLAFYIFKRIGRP